MLTTRCLSVRISQQETAPNAEKSLSGLSKHLRSDQHQTARARIVHKSTTNKDRSVMEVCFYHLTRGIGTNCSLHS